MYILSILLLSTIITAQSNKTIILDEKFNNAASMTVDESGFIYITDLDDNTISKYDTLGNYIHSIGGFGWDRSTFDMPLDISYRNLSLYVSDMNNHRVQVFDRALNYLSQITAGTDSEEEMFRYPTKLAVSKFGEIYIIDSENTRVVKLNTAGEELTTLGDYDSGAFILSNPLDLSLVDDLKLVVLEEKALTAFDIFGNGINRIKTERKFSRIYFTGTKILAISGNKIFSLSLINEQLLFPDKKPIITIDESEEIRDVLIFKNSLYILTENDLLKTTNFRIK